MFHLIAEKYMYTKVELTLEILARDISYISKTCHTPVEIMK